MIFKTIEDEAGKTSIKLNNIFSKTAAESEFKFSEEFFSALKRDTDAISNYRTKVKDELVPKTEALAICFREASAEAKNFAETTLIDNLSPDKYEVKAKQTQIAVMAQGKSLSNVNKLIAEYNTGLKKCELGQEEFISGIKQSNPQLAKYLSTVKQGDASVIGYTASTIGATAATVAFKVAAIALNAALTMGISAALSFGISLISDFINKEEKLIEKLEETGQEFSNLVSEGDSLQSKLTEVNDKIAEIQSKGKISLTDEAELNNLKVQKYTKNFACRNIGRR